MIAFVRESPKAYVFIHPVILAKGHEAWMTLAQLPGVLLESGMTGRPLAKISLKSSWIFCWLKAMLPPVITPVLRKGVLILEALASFFPTRTMSRSSEFHSLSQQPCRNPLVQPASYPQSCSLSLLWFCMSQFSTIIHLMKIYQPPSACQILP